MSTPPRSGKLNRLSAQTSPYLLQHRLNPVDWFPWGPEAFAEARRRDVPIFLSIGYSTCYWCHVMERESFESGAIAAQMNAGFVCVKVDREERPDVDDVYMAAVQAFTQRGGWPMSVFLEPRTLKPFWAGTYFSDKPKFQGIPSFPQVLESISRAWRETRAEVLEQAEQLAEAVRERVAGAPEMVRIGEGEVTQAVMQLLRLHDSIHGGFGPAPKFPQPAFLDLLLTVRRVAGDDDTARAIDSALTTTLAGMARGGIFDQIGGGFHRYSVDERWLVPHFEKMLYDNGALAETYARAAQSAGEGGEGAPAWMGGLYARTARRICEYVLREMASPEGAFFSAQDAEVNHREGQNYLWTSEQIRGVLGAEDAEWIIGAYGLSGGANFRDPHHPTDAAANVLFLSPRAQGLKSLGLGTDEANLFRLDAINARLYEARAQRNQPSRDDKIIAGWNGLMIAGLAVTGAVLREASFVRAAGRAADFVLGRMRAADGGLYRCFAAGVPAIEAFLEDYALLAHGLIEVHLAGGDAKYLLAARELCAEAEARFGDGRGGFYDTLADREDLFVRARSLHDGAMPSGSSVMANNFIDLALITGEAGYRVKAAKLLAALSGAIAAHPLGAANATRALLRMLALDRRALEGALEGAPAAATERASDSLENPVEILSAVESVEVGPDQPVGIVLRVRIADGYHLTAADPGEGVVGLTPFKVHVVSGTGVAAFADYPLGETSGDDGHLVYRGEFDLPVVLERTGVWQGTPLLAVTYQPCTDRACLAATTVELQLSIEKT